MDTVRLDKWLWAARFFKTRALASDACDLGRIEANGHRAKPARDIRPGDLLHIRSDAGDFHVEVLLLSAARGPAAIAQTLYRETDASRAARLQLSEQRKLEVQLGILPDGRPSKRDRQERSRLRGKIHRF